MENKTYIGQFREFFDPDFGEVRSCTIDTDIGDFLFGIANEILYLRCIPDTIMFEAHPSEKESEVTGFYDCMYDGVLWEVRYTIQDHTQPEAFVILELCKQRDVSPISPTEEMIIALELQTGKTLNQILKWE